MKIQVDDERIAFILNKLNVEMHGGQLLFNDKNRPYQLKLFYRPDGFEIDALGIKSVYNSLLCDVIYDVNVLLDDIIYYFIFNEIKQIKTGSVFHFEIVYSLESGYDVSNSKLIKQMHKSGAYKCIDENSIIRIINKGQVLKDLA